MKMSSTATILVVSGLSIVLLIGAALWETNKPSALDQFAQCITSKGAEVYSAWWCPHCLEQKALFGSSYKYIKQHECGAGKGELNPTACPDIKGTPTWKDSAGGFYQGSQDLQTLADRYSCTLPAGYEKK